MRWTDYLHEAQRDGRMLFNSPVAFLKSCAVAGGMLHLELAPTDYKTFLVTTLRDRAWFETHCPAAITPALGNSIVLTHQGVAYLGMRAAAVAAYPRRAHLFGGVLDWPVNRVDDSSVLLDHLDREMTEELGLTEHDLAAPPRALAVLRDPVLAQPELVWHGELLKPLTVNCHALDAREHDHILALPLEDREMFTNRATPVAGAVLRMLRQQRI